ncbi:aldehyde dehydrogenase (NAD+) [Streptomyces sp. Ncost-T6T-2b]|nr:aldehyde dehydrogenase (NAD+) [Streptomyces sp. Ncost-T6T-2b]
MPHFETDILIAGRWRRGAGEPLDTVDPATGRVLATLRAASADEVDEAARAAAKAAADPAWRDLLAHERARLLHRIAELTEQAADELAAVQTADTGKTLAETRALVLGAAGTFRYLAAALECAEDSVTPSRGPYVTMSVHEPLGVVGAINPWNSPIASDAQKIAPALAAGNAILLKPAAWTPLVSLALGRLITRALDEFRLPTALLSVLPGSGRVVGDAVVRHPLVARIGFTGGTETGRSIAAIAAQKLVPASLELGGKSPTIVRADADFEQALAGVMFGIFSSSGQSCIAGSRLFVAREIYDSFVGELVERVRKLRVGPGTEPGTHGRPPGPPPPPRRRRRLRGPRPFRGRAGPVRRLGAQGEPYEDGAYYLPTVLDGLPNTSRTCQEEIFGPVLVALPYGDDDDLVRQANDSVYGLACGIWTRDLRAAWQLARRIEAGTVWINTYKQFSAATPFSGWKDSGLGTEKGRDAIRAYQRQKSLYWGTSGHPLPWAG